MISDIEQSKDDEVISGFTAQQADSRLRMTGASPAPADSSRVIRLRMKFPIAVHLVQADYRTIRNTTRDHPVQVF